MDVEQLKDDVREGRISPDRLVDLVATLTRQLQAATGELQAANERIEELERRLGDPSSEKVDEPFSVEAEEQRQEQRGEETAAAEVLVATRAERHGR